MRDWVNKTHVGDCRELLKEMAIDSVRAQCVVTSPILDPFMGSGTVAKVATDLGRSFIGCELNPEYVELHDLRRTTIGMPI
jgi:DNA modification methylase